MDRGPESTSWILITHFSKCVCQAAARSYLLSEGSLHKVFVWPLLKTTKKNVLKNPADNVFEEGEAKLERKEFAFNAAHGPLKAAVRRVNQTSAFIKMGRTNLNWNVGTFFPNSKGMKCNRDWGFQALAEKQMETFCLQKALLKSNLFQSVWKECQGEEPREIGSVFADCWWQ